MVKWPGPRERRCGARFYAATAGALPFNREFGAAWIGRGTLSAPGVRLSQCGDEATEPGERLVGIRERARPGKVRSAHLIATLHEKCTGL